MRWAERRRSGSSFSTPVATIRSSKTMTRSMALAARSGAGLPRIEPEGATLVAYAAKHGQLAQDGEGKNSPFVTALIKNLQVPGIEISLLFRKVRDDVLTATGPAAGALHLWLAAERRYSDFRKP